MGQAEEPPGDLKRLHDVENVTHSMQQDARLGRRITFFHLGNLVGCGETGPIPADPKDPRTESYITGRIG